MAADDEQEWQMGDRLVAVTNLDKVFWPDEGLSKGDMLAYYRRIAPAMLPHIRLRPLTLRIYPEGSQGAGHWRRDAPDYAPEWLPRQVYQPVTTEQPIELLLVDDAAGIVWWANAAAIEFHAWACRASALDEPDMAVFDLDPGERASFANVLQAGLRLRDALDGRGLRCFPKTSGGRGMHVYMPLSSGHAFDQVRDWVKALAEELADKYPRLIAVAHGSTHRGSQVTIDYAQNSLGRNTAAPYTVRARPGAPVSAPLTWDEVEEGRVRPEDFAMGMMPERVASKGDLFAAVLKGGQSLTA